jgi:hypothetical protein
MFRRSVIFIVSSGAFEQRNDCLERHEYSKTTGDFTKFKDMNLRYVILNTNRFRRGGVESDRPSSAFLHWQIRCATFALGSRLHSNVPRLRHYQYHYIGRRHTRRSSCSRHGFFGVFSQGAWCCVELQRAFINVVKSARLSIWWFNKQPAPPPQISSIVLSLVCWLISWQ